MRQQDPVTIAIEPPRQSEVERLLDGSSAYAQSLYPPESNFLLDLTTLERPEVAFYVARIGANAVGIAALVAEGAGPPGAQARDVRIPAVPDASPRGELKRMFVDPSARGRGVAAALLTRIEADAAARGIREIVLETGDLHHAAQALYTRHGYRRIPQFGQYVGEPHSVCFAKPLAHAEPVRRHRVALLSSSDAGRTERGGDAVATAPGAPFGAASVRPELG